MKAILIHCTIRLANGNSGVLACFREAYSYDSKTVAYCDYTVWDRREVSDIKKVHADTMIYLVRDRRVRYHALEQAFPEYCFDTVRTPPAELFWGEHF